ncbi:MAG: class I SAM-dependent methyltransferase [Dehalococcoidia bacterium]
MRLYSELAGWFHLLTHPKDYAEEAAAYAAIIKSALPGARTVLELGSGGGNNASHLKAHFSCTLTDLSAEMLAISRPLNPECEHILGDMRTLRLGRQFDAVFVHDAIEYMTTLTSLTEAAETAFVHTRPGGVALFIPDGTAETFEPSTDHGGHDGDDGRALRYLEWTLPPKPGETSYDVHFAMLLREDGEVRLEHDRHTFSLFSYQQWVDVLSRVGFTVSSPALDHEDADGQVAFLCLRPA